MSTERTTQQATLGGQRIDEADVDAHVDATELLERLGDVRQKLRDAADSIPADIDGARYEAQTAVDELDRVLAEVRDE